ncbi:transcription-repair coupling factor, partial [Pseudomonas sp. MWU13-2625]
VTAFRQHYREKMEGDPSKSRVYKDVSQGLWPAGIEYFLPLFFDETATLFDYVGDDALLVQHHDVQAAAETFWRDAQGRYEMARGDVERPVLAPADIFLRPDELMARLKPYARIEFSGDGETSAPALPELAVDRRADAPLHKLQSFIAAGGKRILLAAESLG